jgi:hypothetical protein
MITNTELLLLVWCIPVIPAYFLIKLSYMSFGESTGMILAAALLWPFTSVIMIALAVIYCVGRSIDYLITTVFLILEVIIKRLK